MVINRKFLLLHLTIVVLLVVAVIMVYPRTQNNVEDKNSVPVYFVKTYGENDFKLQSVRRKIYKDENSLKVALSELLKGPTKNEENLGYFSEIPKQTQLIELKETPERVTINISKDFEIGGGSAAMSLRLEQLVNTALNSVDKKPVYLELEGEQVRYIGGEGVIVPQPLSGNLNKSQDI